MAFFLGPRAGPAELARAGAAHDGHRLRAVDLDGSVAAACGQLAAQNG